MNNAYLKLLVILLLFAGQCFAGEKSYGNITCEVVSVYDGDTFTVNIPAWPTIVGEHIGIRVNGIDTPERTSKNSKVKELSGIAKECASTMLKSGKKVELRNIKRDKYFRIDADVYVDNVNLADVLIDKGLAKPYDGGKKPSWTAKDYESYKASN